MKDPGRRERRPLLVAIAGPNGAGKTTFHEVFLADLGLAFVNADSLARDLGVDENEAARMANAMRRTLRSQGESFVFETVFSDPVGDKLGFLKQAAAEGYAVVLCFIGLSGAVEAEQRVAMRVSQGGHDVATEKLTERYPRILENLRRAIRELPDVRVFDNDDLARPYRLVAVFEDGRLARSNEPLPAWLSPLIAGPEDD